MIALRAVAPADRPFLLRVYAATREEELAAAPWSPGQKDAFLRMQFAAQDSHYRAHYPGAEFSVVLVDGEPAGRLTLARWPDELRIVDIELLPAFRGRGVGTALLEQALAEADVRGVPTSICVERQNPARALYERLGFRLVGDDGGVYLLLVRAPARRSGGRRRAPEETVMREVR